MDAHNFELVQTSDGSLREEKIPEGGTDGGVLASPSLETLYLMDDAMGPVSVHHPSAMLLMVIDGDCARKVHHKHLQLLFVELSKLGGFNCIIGIGERAFD